MEHNHSGSAFRRKQTGTIIKNNGGERSNKMNNMIKEFTETTISKAKEDITITQGLIVLIAAVSFLTGIIVGILCASGSKAKKKRRMKKSSFDADEYARQLNFDNFDDFDGGDDDGSYEYAF